MKNCSLWEGPTLEEFREGYLPWVRVRGSKDSLQPVGQPTVGQLCPAAQGGLGCDPMLVGTLAGAPWCSQAGDHGRSSVQR